MCILYVACVSNGWNVELRHNQSSALRPVYWSLDFLSVRWWNQSSQTHSRVLADVVNTGFTYTATFCFEPPSLFPLRAPPSARSYPPPVVSSEDRLIKTQKCGSMSAFEQLAGRDPDRSFSNGLGQRGDHLPARSAKRSNNTLSNASIPSLAPI